MRDLELQAAIDVNRASTPRHQRSSKSTSQTRSQTSPSQSLAQSVRSSPHLNGRPNPLPDVSSLPAAPQPFVPHSAPSHGAHSHHLPPRAAHAKPHQIHPLPERPVLVDTVSPRPRRPAPAKSLPVAGWTAIDGLPSPRSTPLFGSFPDRLPINATPKLATARASPVGSPPSPSMFGPGGPFERVTKQRGKLAIGVEGNAPVEDSTAPQLAEGAAATVTDDQSDTQSTLGRDPDGWFVVSDSARPNSLHLDSQPQQRLEFGHFGVTVGPSSSVPPSRAESRSSAGHGQSYSYTSTRRYNQHQHQNSDGSYRSNTKDNRRGSFSGDVNGNSSYRSASQSQYGGPTNPNRRNGTGRGGRGGPNNRSTGASGYNGGGRSMSTSNPSGYRNNQHQNPYNPYSPTHRNASSNYRSPQSAFDPSDPQQAMYGPPLGAVNPYYSPSGLYSPMIPSPYMNPYAPYPYAAAQNPYVSPTPGAVPGQTPGVPPIPMPATQTAYGLDPLRYWLLGQVSWVFSCDKRPIY